MKHTIKFDSNGIPFDFPTCYLDHAEYAKIISEINTNYALYRNKPFAMHYSVGIDGCYYVYFFENHGYNDYNITERYEI